MDLRAIFPLCFGLCSYFVNYSFSQVVILDYSKEIDKVLGEMKISNPTENEKKFAKKIVEERIQNKNDKHEHEHETKYLKTRADRLEMNLTNYIEAVGKIKSEKDTAQKDLLRLKLPVLVRTIRDRLQEKWEKPSDCERCLQFGHATNQCTRKHKTRKSKDPKEEKLRRAERFWHCLITTHKKEVEVKRLLSALRNSLKKSDELYKKYSFREYLNEFYRNFAIACDMTDSKVHVDEMVDKIKKLNIFGFPIDDFMLPLIQSLGYITDPNLPAVIYDKSQPELSSTSSSISSSSSK